ncbi:UDP-N-acetylmuramoyl-L-alanyl-D-glutamate--2,6-diaminopimelate ligase [Hazenella sp. IB182353]|uniref:UDP-N-acetylmuramoyl-L-alanyl-D-glutamate--2, 6-diaminopimelate ligase n=1 Tax=Polycladospora coralii TaxID=2771432 RepID=UPI00174617CC|nr:UDP-N-acetylmuramoyl-L-alanyl-D-glutamate--2,6-diaminopimelate ligase [Polycladospora coralii]
MYLSQLIQPLAVFRAEGDLNVNVTDIVIDSRQIKPGDLFVAIRGHQSDGHRYISKAIENGAVAVVAEESLLLDVPLLIVPDSRRAMAHLAATFYGHPSRELKLIGVTGTNGKTTTTHLIEHLLHTAHKEVGLIGTIGMRFGGQTQPVRNTTPDAQDLQKGFRMMKEAGCEYAVMEVSSHALDMGRTRGSFFQYAIFTNLTQDHLDYHKTMGAYREAKGLLFSQLNMNNVAILNQDDVASDYFAHITSAQVITYGIEKKADVRAENIRVSASGTHFTLKTFRGDISVSMKMIGKFNVYNVLAATCVALAEGLSLEQIRDGLASLSGVPGRFELVETGQNFATIVDYAHTPDSLKNALETILEFSTGKVFTVVGCGGDRDREKRPLMAKMALAYSDLTIFTTDNPRSEDPKQILADMTEGLTDEEFKMIEDRKQAIQTAMQSASDGDIVFIAGKGHETYQEVNGVRYHFDDREVAKLARS